MKITLRRANALQNSIQEHIKTVEVKTQVSLNEFQDPTAEIESARQLVITNDQRRDKLTGTLYALRANIGRANAAAGISDMLARAAYVDKRIGHLKTLIDSTAAESLTVIKGKLDKIRNDKSERRMFGYNDTVNTSVLMSDEVDQFRKTLLELKKLKQSINDQILELNVKTEIEIDAESLQILQSEQLV